MWLRDGLAHDVEGVQCLIWGYDTHLANSQSFQNADDIATSLAFHLRSLARASPSKPIIVIAHSLGGIILKRALVAIARDGNDESDASLRSIKAVLMFGVPSKGMLISHLAAVVKDHPNEQLIQTLQSESPYLRKLHEQYYEYMSLRDIRLISFYETQQSQLLKVT